MPTRTGALALLLAAAALQGCGGSDDTDAQRDGAVGGDQREVLETIDALQGASRRGDSRMICTEIFTPELARSIENASGRTCATEVRGRLFRPGQSISVGRSIDVRGNTATAIIREQTGDVSTLHMLKRDGRWRINRVRPRDES